jgi:5-methylcytosine-specific restriction endonuclease McrA
VRDAVERRAQSACESCGLQWPWSLCLFRIEEDGPNTAANLVALCLKCSEGRDGAFTPLIGQRTLRVRLRDANNRRAEVTPLTESRRRKLIAARGPRCEICAGSGAERPLEVHHKIAILNGGHDGEENLQVLCFACHRNLQRCATGCGALANRARGVCQNCLIRKRLEDLLPEATWEEIKARFPGFVRQWKDGYEPLPLARAGTLAGVSPAAEVPPVTDLAFNF